MAPKKQQVGEEEMSLTDLCKLIKQQSDQIKSQSDQLASINQKVDKIELVENEVKNLKTLVTSLRDENKQLREEVNRKEKQLDDMQSTVNGLETRLNNLEQHHRGWSARVMNIPVSEEEEKNPTAMIHKVFHLALRPILEGAVQIGKLQSLPAAEQVLEVAHVLPGKPGAVKPIIMRFFSRNIRNLIFQLKRDFASREEPSQGAVTRRSGANADGRYEGKGRFRYPLYDDLTKANLSKMKAIAADSRVQSCWTVNGQIRFRLKDSDAVRKVVSILDPLDLILK